MTVLRFKAGEQSGDYRLGAPPRDATVTLEEIAGQRRLRVAAIPDQGHGKTLGRFGDGVIITHMSLSGLRVRPVGWTGSNLHVFTTDDDAKMEGMQVAFMCHLPGHNSRWVFACPDIHVLRIWIELLRRAGCIMSDFSMRHTITQVLGLGGTGTVYGAETIRDRSQIALKCTHTAAGKSQMQNEADILMGLHHRNIIQAYGLFEFKLHGEMTFAMALEWHQGGELCSRLEQDVGLSETATYPILCQLSKALKYVHSKNIVHRDVKLSNILCTVERDGSLTVVLSDFGLATHMSDRDEMRRRCGSPGYIAPEMLAGLPYDERVDSFSLGVVAYQLLVGATPFDAESIQATIKLNMTADLPLAPLEKMSVKAQLLIADLCARDPDDRLHSSEYLSHPWMRALNPDIQDHQDRRSERPYIHADAGSLYSSSSGYINDVEDIWQTHDQQNSWQSTAPAMSPPAPPYPPSSRSPRPREAFGPFYTPLSPQEGCGPFYTPRSPHEGCGPFYTPRTPAEASGPFYTPRSPPDVPRSSNADGYRRPHPPMGEQRRRQATQPTQPRNKPFLPSLDRR